MQQVLQIGNDNGSDQQKQQQQQQQQQKQQRPSCLERLQKEAQSCLEGFPSKVTDLNGIIEIYAPKTGSIDAETINRLPRYSRSISSTIGEYNVTLLSREIDEKIGKSPSDLESLPSYCTISSYERSRNCHGICKRRFHKIHKSHGALLRRRPGALGQLLALIASKLAACTKSMLIAPSVYIADRLISIIFQRPEFKNAQCGPSADWANPLPPCGTSSLKEDKTLVGKFINTMRPAAVQLISDTTILKRWLQALATSSCQSSTELTNATRNAETIDCWAYELFFHLKYLQVNRARDADKVTDVSGMNDDVTHMNLWHRLVQLRDNYIILYEILHVNPWIRKLPVD